MGRSDGCGPHPVSMEERIVVVGAALAGARVYFLPLFPELLLCYSNDTLLCPEIPHGRAPYFTIRFEHHYIFPHILSYSPPLTFFVTFYYLIWTSVIMVNDQLSLD